ncbi:MAG: transcription termination factor NusA [Gemmatimonadetes bacterium]|nr:transcription termination factor NusA [Gemmatimonadota bacterium]
MNYEVIEALAQIIREKNVEREVVWDTVKTGLVTAAKKRFGTGDDNVEVRVDEKLGTIEMAAVWDVVDEVEDPETQITLDAALDINPEAEVGGRVEQELAFEEFGRNAIQAVKQVVVQRVREAERENVFELYKDRVNEIVIGSVQQVDRGNIIVKIERTEALLPWREQIRRERYRQGETIRAFILDVQNAIKGPQVILSRSCEAFLELLFRMEVPEIHEGIVEIKASAREPGDRSKIAVLSHDDRVDAVGACVGMKGTRVQAVVRELNNERIDIVPWSNDPSAFVTQALRPAEVAQVQILDIEKKDMRVVVEDDQLSLAIGKAGQNARLAVKLTGWNIDLIKRSDLEKQLISETFGADDGEGEEAGSLADIDGISEKLRQKLEDAGYTTVESLQQATADDLQEISGIGGVTADKIMTAVQ